MRKVLLFSGLGLCLLAATVLAQEPTPRAIIEKAIKAHGGEQVLSKFKASHSQSKGKVHLNGMELPFTAEEYVQFPDKFKSLVQLDFNGMNISIIQVFDGKKGWIKANDQSMDLEEQASKEITEILHATRVGNLVSLLSDAKFKLAPLGDSKVKDKDAVGVRVSYDGRRDVNLYFDKQTGLLAKTEGRGLNPVTKQECGQEKLFMKYHEVQGRKTPQHVEVFNDGALFVEVDIQSLDLLERHDDDTFKQP